MSIERFLLYRLSFLVGAATTAVIVAGRRGSAVSTGAFAPGAAGAAALGTAPAAVGMHQCIVGIGSNVINMWSIGIAKCILERIIHKVTHVVVTPTSGITQLWRIQVTVWNIRP